ncbi:hypothetical protein CLF_104437 [Clonorchis sinensis]|uniref:Uncharacterized protein n=1 Tax=Clonorchis sinensis TaxID=79923 RepID=G7YBN9_CLOSI|nr:hypothetical protein CLF_104437 [Clonorchis sinensis]
MFLLVRNRFATQLSDGNNLPIASLQSYDSALKGEGVHQQKGFAYYVEGKGQRLSTTFWEIITPTLRVMHLCSHIALEESSIEYNELAVCCPRSSVKCRKNSLINNTIALFQKASVSFVPCNVCSDLAEIPNDICIQRFRMSFFQRRPQKQSLRRWTTEVFHLNLSNTLQEDIPYTPLHQTVTKRFKTVGLRNLAITKAIANRVLTHLVIFLKSRSARSIKSTPYDCTPTDFIYRTTCGIKRVSAKLNSEAVCQSLTPVQQISKSNLLSKQLESQTGDSTGFQLTKIASRVITPGLIFGCQYMGENQGIQYFSFKTEKKILQQDGGLSDEAVLWLVTEQLNKKQEHCNIVLGRPVNLENRSTERVDWPIGRFAYPLQPPTSMSHRSECIFAYVRLINKTRKHDLVASSSDWCKENRLFNWLDRYFADLYSQGQRMCIHIGRNHRLVSEKELFDKEYNSFIPNKRVRASAKVTTPPCYLKGTF